MAREKPFPEPKEDVAAWFMTYSDVITLLMTFFILLLTFATTEPDRFERVQRAVFSGGGASGIAGEAIDGMELDSNVQRVRPRAARMSMKGAEMPSYLTEPTSETVGNGIMGGTVEESEMDVMSTNQFDIKLKTLVDDESNLTSKGVHVAGLVASQLRRLPVHLLVQVSASDDAARATAFIMFLYHSEKIRPGQVGVGLSDDIPSETVRFSIERYEQ